MGNQLWTTFSHSPVLVNKTRWQVLRDNSSVFIIFFRWVEEHLKAEAVESLPCPHGEVRVAQGRCGGVCQLPLPHARVWSNQTCHSQREPVPPLALLMMNVIVFFNHRRRSRLSRVFLVVVVWNRTTSSCFNRYFSFQRLNCVFYVFFCYLAFVQTRRWKFCLRKVDCSLSLCQRA